MSNFSDLLGLTITACDLALGEESVNFETKEGRTFVMFHSQDCCEHVSVEDISGDMADVIGSPITMAEESESDENPEGVNPDYQDSFTWTFYRLGTAKGMVTIRWYGSSNGYYSEQVDFVETKP